MHARKSGLMSVAMLLCAIGSAAQGASFDTLEGEVLSRQGVIQRLDFEANTIEVSGFEFAVPLDTPVTIRGGPGALTLLAEGMKAVVIYRQLPEGRLALSVDQLPDNAEIEEH